MLSMRNPFIMSEIALLEEGRNGEQLAALHMLLFNGGNCSCALHNFAPGVVPSNTGRRAVLNP